MNTTNKTRDGDAFAVLYDGPSHSMAAPGDLIYAGRIDRLLNPLCLKILLVFFALSCIVAQAATEVGKPGVIETLIKWTPLLAQGFVWNVVISGVAIAVGTVAGFLLGIAMLSPQPWLRAPSSVVIQFLRNAPWLVLLFYCMFLMPFKVTVFGMTIPVPDWLKASFGFALPVMAYVVEIVRGAVQSIPAGQWDSAESLAFSRRQILWLVIIPQCMKRMLPAWMNLYAIVVMASTLANVVGVSESMTITREILSAERRKDLLLPMYAYLLCWFFIYCYPISRMTSALERKWNVVN